MTAFSHLQTWEEFIQVGGELREKGDSVKWDLGDCALECCQRSIGRPGTDSQRRTITEFAKAIGEDRPVISNLIANAEFFDAAARAQIPLQLSWRQTANARRRGAPDWKPGERVTRRMRQAALSILFRMADNAPGGHVRGTPPALIVQIDAALRSIEKALANPEATPDDKRGLESTRSILLHIAAMKRNPTHSAPQATETVTQ